MKADKFGLKPEAIKDICDKILPDAKKNINQDKCPICKRLISSIPFADSISIQEFHISGLCQVCQDSVFK